MVARYKTLPLAERHEVVATLTSRVPYAKSLLAAISAKRIPKSVLDSATTRRQIRGFADAETDRLMVQAWGQSRRIFS